MKKYITPAMILSWSPCSEYNEARIRSLFGTQKRATVTNILKAPIPPQDALWVVLREELIPPKTLRLFACACAERALKRERDPDARSWDAVKTARRYAMGKGTAEELAAAREAAWAAAGEAWAAGVAAGAAGVAARAAWEAAKAAWAAAGEAARAAAREAAWAAAREAAWAAAGEAEVLWQKRKLLSMLKTRRTPSAGR